MVIPIILLGEARDRHLLDALRSLLGERCAWQTREGIFWKEMCIRDSSFIFLNDWVRSSLFKNRSLRLQ